MNKLIDITNGMYLSDLWEAKHQILVDEGIFDRNIYFDENKYISIKSLKETKIPEFQGSWKRVINDFRKIIELIRKKKNDLAVKYISKKFKEAKEIGLGVGNLVSDGKGIGEETAKKIVNGIEKHLSLSSDFSSEDIFLMLGFTLESVANDRMSDIIFSIIRDDVELYTINKYKKITKKNVLPQANNDITPFAMPLELLSDIKIFGSFTEFIENSEVWLDSKREGQELLNDTIKNIHKKIIERKELKKNGVETELVNTNEFNNIMSNINDAEKYSEINEKMLNYQMKKISKNNLIINRIKTGGFINEISCENIDTLLKKIVNSHTVWNTINIFYNEKNNLIRELDIGKYLSRDIAIEIARFGGKIYLEPQQGRSRFDLIINHQNKEYIIEFKKANSNKLEDGWLIQTKEYKNIKDPECIKYIILDTTWNEDKHKKNEIFINDFITENPIEGANAFFLYFNVPVEGTKKKEYIEN